MKTVVRQLGKRPRFFFGRRGLAPRLMVLFSILSVGAGYYAADLFHSGADVQLVARVVDGDTILLTGGERVRLVGIDTPESHASAKLERDSRRSGKDQNVIVQQGKAAAEYARALLAGKAVRLSYDIERRDRYGRLLAYVFLEDGTFVNARLVAEGYAVTYTVPPNVKYAPLFLMLERRARHQRRGLWQ